MYDSYMNYSFFIDAFLVMLLALERASTAASVLMCSNWCRLTKMYVVSAATLMLNLHSKIAPTWNKLS